MRKNKGIKGIRSNFPRLDRNIYEKMSLFGRFVVCSGYSLQEIADQLSMSKQKLIEKLIENDLFTIRELNLLATFLPFTRAEMYGLIDNKYSYRSQIFYYKKHYLRFLYDRHLYVNGYDKSVFDVENMKLMAGSHLRRMTDSNKVKDIDLNDLDFFDI